MLTKTAQEASHVKYKPYIVTIKFINCLFNFTEMKNEYLRKRNTLFYSLKIDAHSLQNQ